MEENDYQDKSINKVMVNQLLLSNDTNLSDATAKSNISLAENITAEATGQNFTYYIHFLLII